MKGMADAGVLVVFYACATVFSANVFFCVDAHAQSVIVIETSCIFVFFNRFVTMFLF